MTTVSPTVARYGAAASIVVGATILFTYVMILQGSEASHSLPRDESAGLIQEKEATDSDALGLSFGSFMKGVKTQEEKMGLVEVWGNRDASSDSDQESDAGKAASLRKLHHKATTAYHKSHRAYAADIKAQPHKALQEAKQMLVSAQKEELLRKAELEAVQASADNATAHPNKAEAAKILKDAKQKVSKAVHQKVQQAAKKAAAEEAAKQASTTQAHRVHTANTTQDTLPGVPGMHSSAKNASYEPPAKAENVTVPLAKDHAQAEHELVHGKERRDKAEWEIRDAISKLRQYGSSSAYKSQSKGSLDNYLSSLGYHHAKPPAPYNSAASSYASSTSAPPAPKHELTPPPLPQDGKHCAAARAMCTLFGWKARNACTSTTEAPEVSFRAPACVAALRRAGSECHKGLEECGAPHPSQEAGEVLQGVIHKPLPAATGQELPAAASVVPQEERHSADSDDWKPGWGWKGHRDTNRLPYDDSREIVYHPPPVPPPPSKEEEAKHWSEAVYRQEMKYSQREAQKAYAAHHKAKAAAKAEAKEDDAKTLKAAEKAAEDKVVKLPAKKSKVTEVPPVDNSIEAKAGVMEEVDRISQQMSHHSKQRLHRMAGAKQRSDKVSRIVRYIRQHLHLKHSPQRRKGVVWDNLGASSLRKVAERGMKKAQIVQALLKATKAQKLAQQQAGVTQKPRGFDYTKASREYAQAGRKAQQEDQHGTASRGGVDHSVERALDDVFPGQDAPPEETAFRQERSAPLQQQHRQEEEEEEGLRQEGSSEKDAVFSEEDDLLQLPPPPETIPSKPAAGNNEHFQTQHDPEAAAIHQLQQDAKNLEAALSVVDDVDDAEMEAGKRSAQEVLSMFGVGDTDSAHVFDGSFD